MQKATLTQLANRNGADESSIRVLSTSTSSASATLMIAAVQIATLMKTLLIRLIPASLAIATLGLPSAFAQTTERVSVDSAGGQSDRSSFTSSISADGRYVAFCSHATILVPGDTNNWEDIFVHDRQTGLTNRVSVDSVGGQGNGSSRAPSISADGRFVAFWSHADNLVAGDTNNRDDVFVHDCQSGQTSRVSVDSAGGQGNGRSRNPSISADGVYVAFESLADDLVPSDTNNRYDVFVHNRQTGQTDRVTVNGAGKQGNGDSQDPSISADGRHVSYWSDAANLVPGDTNNRSDVFVYDFLMGLISRVSVDSAGGQGNSHSEDPSISADGRFVAYWSSSTNLVTGDFTSNMEVFVHDLQTGRTSRMSVDSSGLPGNGDCQDPSISADGRHVAFQSTADNLVPSDTNGLIDVFVHDRLTGQTRRVILDSTEYSDSSISANGETVTFSCTSTNLVPGDTNNCKDVFVHDRGTPGPSLAQVGSCPGAITLTVSNASPNGSVALLYGPTGTFVKAGAPCQGLILGISPPTLGAMVTASGSGSAVLNFNAPPGLCGRSAQAVDVTTCVATNVLVL